MNVTITNVSHLYNSSYYFSNYTDRIPLNYYYYYVHPTFVLLAGVICILCSYILAQRELRTSGPFFQYAAVNSFTAGLASPCLAMYFLTRCGSLCTTSPTYWSQVYEIYGIYFFTSSVFFSTSLVQIAISFQLYLSVTQKFKRLNSISPKYVMLVLFFVSFGLGATIPFAFLVRKETYVVIENGMQTIIELYRNRIDPTSIVLVYISYTVVIFSNYIFLIILIIVNVLIFIELRKLMAKKIKMTKKNQVTAIVVIEKKTEMSNAHSLEPTKSTAVSGTHGTATSNTKKPAAPRKSIQTNKPHESNEQETQRKTLIMTLWISVVFCSHRLAYAIANLILIVDEGSALNDYASAVFYFYGSLVYSSYMLVYYVTNKIFRKKFNEIILRRKS